MNKKFLAASLMSIAMLTSIATGATYALFTAEDTVNVNVTAGKVSVTANVLPKFKVKSYNSELTEVEKEGTFAAGGKVTVEENGSITLDRIVPGDRVEFDVEIKRNSGKIWSGKRSRYQYRSAYHGRVCDLRPCNA